MENLILVGIIVAFGFVSAAIIRLVFMLFVGQQNEFRVSFDSAVSVSTAFVVIMFAGSYITLMSSWRYWYGGAMSGLLFCIAAILSILWSFCSGVLIIQMLIGFGLVAN